MLISGNIALKLKLVNEDDPMLETAGEVASKCCVMLLQTVGTGGKGSKAEELRFEDCFGYNGFLQGYNCVGAGAGRKLEWVWKSSGSIGELIAPDIPRNPKSTKPRFDSFPNLFFDFFVIVFELCNEQSLLGWLGGCMFTIGACDFWLEEFLARDFEVVRIELSVTTDEAPYSWRAKSGMKLAGGM